MDQLAGNSNLYGRVNEYWQLIELGKADSFVP